MWLGGRGWHWEHGSQGLAGVTLGTGGDFLGCSGGDNLPALVAGVGAEVDDPIGGFHDLKVVLDDDDGVTGVHQALENSQQHAHIVEVQAGGRLVEEEERGGRRGQRLVECGVRRGPRCGGGYHCFGEVADQFQALAFAAGEGVDGLAEPEIAKPHFFQQLQTLHRAPRRTGFGEAGQEGDGFFDGGVQQVGDVVMIGIMRTNALL